MNIRTRGYYARRSVVRFVFWWSVFIALSFGIIEVMTRFTSWWYGVPLP